MATFSRPTRRAFLKAAGVTLALPWLESAAPPLAPAAGGPPRRFVGVMTNQGILPQFFFPKEAGRDYVAPPYLEILKDHRADMTVLSGVALPGVDGGHASEKSFLTGTPHPGRGAFRNGISLDQLIAEQIGGDTRFPSLTLMAGSDNASLSWTRSGAMIPPITSPLKLYRKLFVDDTAQGRIADRQRLHEDRSLLDGLRDQAKRLESSLNAADRERFDQYTTAVRDLERRLAKADAWIDIPKPKVTTKPPEDLRDSTQLVTHQRLLYDLIRLALETDSTRVVTLCVSLAAVTARQIPGVTNNTHELTHHGNRPEKIAELRLIESSLFQTFGDLLAGLRTAKEQGVPLLDRTCLLFGTNMGSANAHSTDNLPALIAGGGFKHAGHLAFNRTNNTPLTNLHLSVLHRLGIEATSFSTSTGTLQGLELA